MPESVNQAYIFVPMIFVVLLTFLTFFRMGAARSRAMKEGMTIEYYRAHIGGGEPEFATVATRHYGNLFELPTLFYAACVTAFVLQGVGIWTVVFAWGYALMRLVQSAVHATYNNPAHRGLAFMLGALFLIALWVNVAIVVGTKL